MVRYAFSSYASLAVALATVGAFPLLTAGCDTGSRVVLGVALRTELVDAARLAIADELSLRSIAGLDTVLIAEDAVQSGPGIDAAGRFAQTGDLVAVVGHTNSAVSLIAAQVYNDNRIVQLSPTATADLYSEAGSFSFRLAPRNEGQGRFLAEFLAKSFPTGARLAVLYVNDDYGRDLRSALMQRLNLEIFDVVLELPHMDRDEIDLEHLMGAIVAARPTGIAWLGRTRALDSFLRALRGTMRGVPIIAGDAVSLAVHYDNSDGRWAGTWYVDFVDLEATESLRAFRRDYKDRFGRAASSPDALTYDATRLVLSGIRAGARSGEEMQKYLMSLGRERPSYAGITGAITFDARGDVERPSFLARKVGEGGRP